MYQISLYRNFIVTENKRGTSGEAFRMEHFPASSTLFAALCRGPRIRRIRIWMVYVARSVVQHVCKDARIHFSLHGFVRRWLPAEWLGVPARYPGGWPKEAPEHTVNSVYGACRKRKIMYCAIVR